MARKWSARKQVIFTWTHGGESRSETSIFGISGKVQLQLKPPPWPTQGTFRVTHAKEGMFNKPRGQIYRLDCGQSTRFGPYLVIKNL